MKIFLPINKIKWLDQFAHFALGLLMVVGFNTLMPTISAVGSTLVLAIIREQLQHFGHMHVGSRTDMLFWLLGSLAGALTTTYWI